METNKESRKPAAMLIAGALTLLTIGVLNIIAEASEALKEFLKFIPAMGPLSGKIILGYSAGIGAYFILSALLKKKDYDVLRLTWVLIAALLLASLLVFTPFVGLIV